MKTGIQNLKAAVGFLATAFTSITAAASDGNIGLRDLSTLIGLARKAPEAFEAAKGAPREIADLDPEEAAELVQGVADALGHDTITPKTQRIAEITLAMLPEFVQLWDALRDEEPPSE